MVLTQIKNKCTNHRFRYRAIIFLHIIDAITSIIRFHLIHNDLSRSKQPPVNLAFPIFILLLELAGTLPSFFPNILYGIIKCFKNEFFADDENPVCCRRRKALRVATLTCFPCRCYQDHPQSMQLTRVIILALFFVLRFIAFILGASCATVYKPRCVPYTVLSSFTLFLFCSIVAIEWYHFDLLWHYRPPINRPITERYHRSHLRFMPHQVTNCARIHKYEKSLCEYQNHCDSKSLHHTLLYHSIRENVRTPLMCVDNGQRINAYYLTTNENAIGIALNGFPVNRYRQLIPEIYFTRTLKEYDTDTPSSAAIIYVRLNLRDLVQVQVCEELDFTIHNDKQRLPQTLECGICGRIKVRFPGQIENWVIVLSSQTDKEFNSSYYDGCI